MATADSAPLERAVNGIGQHVRIAAQRRGSQDGLPIADAFWRGIETAHDRLTRFFLDALRHLAASDPAAFAAVLTECGMEPTDYEWCTADRTIVNLRPPAPFMSYECGDDHEALYRLSRPGAGGDS